MSHSLCINFSVATKLLAIGRKSGNIEIFDIITGEIIKTF